MPSAIRRRHFPCCGLVRVLLENRYRNIACFALGETETLDSAWNQGFLFLLWYHQHEFIGIQTFTQRIEYKRFTHLTAMSVKEIRTE